MIKNFENMRVRVQFHHQHDHYNFFFSLFFKSLYHSLSFVYFLSLSLSHCKLCSHLHTCIDMSVNSTVNGQCLLSVQPQTIYTPNIFFSVTNTLSLSLSLSLPLFFVFFLNDDTPGGVGLFGYSLGHITCWLLFLPIHPLSLSLFLSPVFFLFFLLPVFFSIFCFFFFLFLQHLERYNLSMFVSFYNNEVVTVNNFSLFFPFFLSLPQ